MIWLVLLCGFMGNMVHAAAVCSNQLQELYHHKNDNTHCLEIGYLLLLFTFEPQERAYMTQHTVLSNGMNQLTFIFEHASAGYNLLKRAQSCMSNGYRFTLKAHDNNLELVIVYDPRKIEVHHSSYTDLDLRRGFIIRFFDHELLNCINNKESYILQTAALGLSYPFNPIHLLV